MSMDDPSTDARQGGHMVEIRRDVRIPTANPQATLSADLYLPAGTDPVPALVTVIPYRKDFLGGISLHAALRCFAERGYACLLVDSRGTGSSDGLPRPKFDSGEGDDAVAAIEWAAAQPWCTGNVGMWGISIGGFATMRAASRRPPNLKAIIPIMTPLDPGREAVHHDGARVDLNQRALWSGSMLVQQLLPPLLNYTSVQEQRRWYQRLHETEPFIVDLARHGPGDPVWQERVIDATSITVPALCVGGWRDLYAEAMTRAYEQIQGPKKLLIGPWMHTMPQDSRFEPIDFLSIALRWWDHWLRGIDNGVMDEPPVTLYRLGSSPGWRSFESWPPAKSELVLATGTDTTLTEPAPDETPATGAIADYQPDPTTGALSGLWGIPNSGFGLPLDQHDDDMRAMSATGEPLPTDLLICGRPEVSVRLARENSTAAPAVQRLVVRLAEVDPHGRSTFITTGVVCPDELSATHRIVLRSTSYTVPAGHRLRVVLSDSDFPRLTPLAHPSPLRVAHIALSAPTLPDDAGAPVHLPAIDKPAPQPSQAGMVWTITRDPIHDGIEVRIGSSTSGVHTSQGHLLETHGEVRAMVRRAVPDATVTTGTHTAMARMSTGETIVVTATVRCTQTALWARGEVTIDDTTTYSRTWEAAL
jgi:putative CocE/NonD family hydrolase